MYTNVSDDFLSAVNGAEPVYCCKLDFGNNVTLNDLFSVSYSGGSCSESIVPGGTVIANAKVELSALPATVRKGSACTLYFGVNGEYAPQGVLTVKKIEKSGERLSVTLEDNMTKTEKGYFSSLSYPSTTLKMLSEIATKCGVAFNTSGLTAVTIKDKPEGYTCREIIGDIAGLYGKFAVCDRTGKIAFKWFDTTAVQLSDFCYDTPTVATDDITVGRVVCGDFTAGTGTAITYDCLFMTQNQLNTVQKSLNGFKYRTGEIPLRLGNMLIDAWDMVSITYGGETVKIPAANISVTYNGGLSMTIEAPAEEQSADSGESYKSPAQKQAERITADIISAKQALLEKADIAELNAQIANLENVYAAKADITELSAQIATIDNLTAKKADVEQLYAKKADIDTLVADTATLKTLKSDVANIDVLLSGKAGTGELTSIKLTAENAEIATALIKDLTAANFRSKTIETDDFTIKSSSGKLQIVGNTIQIKDVNNTVRVQIGEDGKSDYGIYVTDANGKIMFTSYDGLHEDGIKSGIIKNDMVADDAHISGSKLDISSVIDGINADNSTYLNTSKVVIDGTSQTINAKFTELTASIGSIGTRTSALESDLSGFRTTVSETYATKSAVDSIQIGGRNLLYDSTGNIKNGWSGNTIITVDGGISGNSLAISRTGYSGNARYFGTNKRHFLTDFEVGTSYTLSAWIKVRSDVELDASGYVMARFRSADDKKLYALSLTVSSQTEKDKWIYYEKTWTINDSDIAKLECVALALDKNGVIEACNIKLEKGTKATDWSPAPEDTTAEITSLSSKQSSLEQTVNGFKATVESTYATNDSVTQKVSAVEQKADKISWIVKSGTSESSMELTSKALEIIAETKIKGDVIVGGVIKSGNYDVAKGTGMKLTLATGEWDSKYFKVSSTGTITATGGTIGGFTISNNSLYNGLDTINHKEGTNETAGVNISVLGGFSAYNGEYGTEMNNGQIRFYSLGRELGYITPGSTDFSDYSKTGIGIVATNQIGSAGLYGRIDLGYKDKINGNTYIAAYSVCCDGKKGSNDGFNSTFHVKTRFSGGIDVSDIYFSYENKKICSIGIAGYYGVGGISPDVYKWLPVFNDYIAFKRGILFDTSNTSLIYHGANRLLACSASKIVVGNSNLALSLIGSSLTSSSTISVSSDARMKNHIADLPSRSENLFDYLDGKSFFYNGDTSTAKNYGFIAQDVLTALQKCGLTTDDFAGFCDIHGDGSQYALAYEQFIPLMWNEIKRLRKALSERS
ncbi:tail fiber domain-containing protein [[Eubacterium] siraeum]|nr:tail fiber domain-containing protein [[Eubacterium] siraeum]